MILMMILWRIGKGKIETKRKVIGALPLRFPPPLSYPTKNIMKTSERGISLPSSHSPHTHAIPRSDLMELFKQPLPAIK